MTFVVISNPYERALHFPIGTRYLNTTNTAYISSRSRSFQVKFAYGEGRVTE